MQHKRTGTPVVIVSVQPVLLSDVATETKFRNLIYNPENILKQTYCSFIASAKLVKRLIFLKAVFECERTAVGLFLSAMVSHAREIQLQPASGRCKPVSPTREVPVQTLFNSFKKCTLT